MEVVIKRFSSEIVKCDQFFVPQYLIDLPSHTTKQLDVIIEMAGEKKHVLMEAGTLARVRAEAHTSWLLYTSDAADDSLCVDLGGRRTSKKKNR